MGTFSLDQAFIREYQNSFEFLYQQDTSYLRSLVRNEPQHSEFKYYDYIAPTQGLWDVPRHSDSPDIPTQHSRRRVGLNTWTWSELVEDFDVIQTLKDPSSDYLKNAVMAAHRAWDEKILDGAYGSAYSGKDGNTTINWYDIGESIGVNSDGTLTTAGAGFTNEAATGLDLIKIARIGTIMDNNNVPSNDRVIVAPFDQKWFLLGSTKVTSSDYATVKALVNGQVDTFMGFHFVWLPQDRFTNDTTDTDSVRCVAFQRGAMLMTTGIELKTRMAEESGKNFAVRVWARQMIGSARMNGKGIVPFLCATTPTLAFNQS